jgi:hypothetical protein
MRTELFGGRNYLADGIIWRTELFGGRNYLADGIIWRTEFVLHSKLFNIILLNLKLFWGKLQGAKCQNCCGRHLEGGD